MHCKIELPLRAPRVIVSGKCSLSWLAATNSLQGDLTAEGQHTGQHDHHTTQAEPDRHGLLSLYSLLQFLEHVGTWRMFA